MKPIERIMLSLYLLQKYETDLITFRRLYRIYRQRYFKYNTIPHTLEGNEVEHILGY